MADVTRRNVMRAGLATGFAAAFGGAQVAQAPAAPPPGGMRRAFTVQTPDGVAIAAQEWGNAQGPEMLLVHGFAQCHLSWWKQVTSALAQDFRIVTYDLRGHGLSDRPADRAAYQENRRWADEVKAVIDAAQLRRPVLVGWSYAGRVVSDYLLTHGADRVSGVNFVNAVTNAALNATAPANAAAGGTVNENLLVQITSTRAFLRQCFSRQPTAEEFELMVGFNAMVPRATRLAMLGRPTPYEEIYKALRIPVLVTHGREDKAVLFAMGEYTARTIPGARMSAYDWIGHSPFWEDPDRFNRELAEFVRASWRA
jgi:pimeloyl-ACP methyl ester carboxylesterase